MNRTILSIACIVLTVGVSLGAGARPGFDTKEVVRRVRKAQAPADFRPVSGPTYDWGEFLLDTSVVCMPAPGDQDMPSIAYDGTNFFVVWHDERGGSYDIYGARVTADGVVIDPSGIAVSAAAGDQLYPTVAFDGTDFLVVWQDERSGWLDIYAARVTGEGEVLDPSGIAVSTAQYDQEFPAVESDGSGFLVVWQDSRGDEYYDIYGARVTAAGAVLDPAGIAISRAVYDQMFPAVDFNGMDYFVVWEDERNGLGDIYGARVTRAGVVLDTAGIAVSVAPDDQGGPGITSDGSNSFVVWHDARSSGYYDIYGARVTQAGVVLDPTGIAVSTAPDEQEWPAAAFDGTNFNVAWQDWRGGMAGDIYCARVSAAGTVLDPSGIAVSKTEDDQGYPRVASAGSNFLLVWQDERGGSYDIYGARVTGSGTVQDTSGIVLTTATNEQWHPAIAAAGTTFLVVWQDNRSGTWDIYAARVTESGMVLDPSGLSVSAASGDQSLPTVASDGETFLVAWTDERGGPEPDIYAARVTHDGVVLDPGGIPVSAATSGQWESSVAFGGTTFLVVWPDARGGSSDVYGARITAAGNVLDPSGIAVSTGTGDQGHPAVASDGRDFFVTWEDSRSGSTYDVYGARVTAAGTVQDSQGVAISTEAFNQTYPAIAFDGTNFLVVWVDLHSASWADISGARVNGDGIVLDTSGFAVCTADYDQWYPRMTFDGANFIVTWTDGRAGSATDIYGARVTPGGAVIDSFPIVTGEGSQWSGDLAAAPGGQTLLAYGGWAGIVAGKNYNTYRIWGKFGPFPGVTEGGQSPPGGSRQMATVARDVLFLPEARSEEREASSVLLDATGRKVTDLRPGPNDVSLLPAGIYFVRGPGEPAAHKVILSR
jgi:hypothetical protein